MRNLLLDIGWTVAMGVLIAGGVVLFPFMAAVLVLLLAQKKLHELFSPQPAEAQHPSYSWRASTVGGARLFQAP